MTATYAPYELLNKLGDFKVLGCDLSRGLRNRAEDRRQAQGRRQDHKERRAPRTREDPAVGTSSTQGENTPYILKTILHSRTWRVFCNSHLVAVSTK
jgi:hypothetical protein